MKKTILMGLLIGILATIALATTGAFSAAYADQGGDPNNADPSQKNANARLDKKDEKRDAAGGDLNPHNDNGPNQARENLLDDHGVRSG